MFQVDIKAMDEAVLELQGHIRKLNQAINETERVVSDLSGTSGMWQIRDTLRKEIDKMEARQKSLQDMLKALREIQFCYRACERNIISHAEDSFRRPQADFEWVQFPTIGFNPDLFRLY